MSMGKSTHGLNALDKEMGTPPTLRRDTAYFSFDAELGSVIICDALTFFT